MTTRGGDNILKKVISIIIVAAMSFTLAAGCFADNAGPFAANPEIPLSSLETQYCNEYDKIVAIRNEAAESNGTNIQENVSKEELEYILSDAIETELLRRASLPTDVLRNYGYSDEAIKILREYDGSRLEQNPQLRSVSATLSGSIEFSTRTRTKVVIVYSWSWDMYPVSAFEDIVAVSWDGTYENGLINNMILDMDSTYALVNYYNRYGIGDGGILEQVNYSEFTQNGSEPGLTSDNTYHGVAVRFPIDQAPGSLSWAGSGLICVFLDLVNQNSGPYLYELNAHAEYAHYYLEFAAGVSFPLGLSISFTGAYEIFGIDNKTVRAI